MNPRAKIWNVLHDGGIEAIDGDVAGDVDIHVSIHYLRDMFSAEGECIIVRLVNCTKLAMKIWDDDVTTDDPERIVATQTQILSTESDDVPVHIITTFGELDIAFERFSLLLDNGQQITLEELCDACENYWKRWENEVKQNQALPESGA